MSLDVVVSPRAERQLRSIADYIEGRTGPAAAAAFTRRVLAACASLSLFPERGTRRDDIHPGLRVMGMRGQATIAFTIHAERVVIQGVYGRGRDVARVTLARDD